MALKIMKIVKLKSLLEGAHPNNIEQGFERTGVVYEDPKVGECFYCGSLRTSLVEEVIDANTFRTMNSVYHITEIEGIDSITTKTLKPVLSAYQQRVVEEKRELDERLTKLRAFNQTDKFQDLKNEDRGLLIDQANAMAFYSSTLGKRIERFSEQGA